MMTTPIMTHLATIMNHDRDRGNLSATKPSQAVLSPCLSHRQSLTVICDGRRAISRIARPGRVMLEGGAMRDRRAGIPGARHAAGPLNPTLLPPGKPHGDWLSGRVVPLSGHGDIGSSGSHGCAQEVKPGDRGLGMRYPSSNCRKALGWCGAPGQDSVPSNRRAASGGPECKLAVPGAIKTQFRILRRAPSSG